MKHLLAKILGTKKVVVHRVCDKATLQYRYTYKDKNYFGKIIRFYGIPEVEESTYIEEYARFLSLPALERLRITLLGTDCILGTYYSDYSGSLEQVFVTSLTYKHTRYVTHVETTG